MNVVIFFAGWCAIGAALLVGWAQLTRPAREARCEAAQDAIDARREAIAAAMNRHPAGTLLYVAADEQAIADFRAQISAFEAGRRASAANG